MLLRAHIDLVPVGERLPSPSVVSSTRRTVPLPSWRGERLSLRIDIKPG